MSPSRQRQRARRLHHSHFHGPRQEPGEQEETAPLPQAEYGNGAPGYTIARFTDDWGQPEEPEQQQQQQWTTTLQTEPCSQSTMSTVTALSTAPFLAAAAAQPAATSPTPAPAIANIETQQRQFTIHRPAHTVQAPLSHHTLTAASAASPASQSLQQSAAASAAWDTLPPEPTILGLEFTTFVPIFAMSLSSTLCFWMLFGCCCLSRHRKASKKRAARAAKEPPPAPSAPDSTTNLIDPDSMSQGQDILRMSRYLTSHQGASHRRTLHVVRALFSLELLLHSEQIQLTQRAPTTLRAAWSVQRW